MKKIDNIIIKPNERKNFEDEFNKSINEKIKIFPNLLHNYLKIYKE